MKVEMKKSTFYKIGFLIIALVSLYLNRMWMKHLERIIASQPNLSLLPLYGIIIPICLGILWNIPKIISLFQKDCKLYFHPFHLVGIGITIGVLFANFSFPLFISPNSCQIELFFLGALISGMFEKRKTEKEKKDEKIS